jgi:hypothetical protein
MLLGCTVTALARAQSIANPANVPSDIRAIMDKPAYKNSVWGLRVVDLKTGKPLIVSGQHGRLHRLRDRGGFPEAATGRTVSDIH